MPDPRTALSGTPKRIGIAADHGGFELMEQPVRILREADYEVIDFGDRQANPDDDCPDYVVPWPEPFPAAKWAAVRPSAAVGSVLALLPTRCLA